VATRLNPHPGAGDEALRLPPHSIEAEQAVLGGLMIDSAAWDQVADRVSSDDFYRHDHRLIFAAAQALIERNQPCDAVTLSGLLESQGLIDQVGGLSYLGTLARDTPTAANIKAYADIVRERSVLRQLITAGNSIVTSALEPEGREAREIVDDAERAVFEIAERGSRGKVGFRSVKAILPDVVTRIDELYNSKGMLTGIPTGFKALDEMTSGLQPGDLIIIAGRPSMGKSTLAVNIAENAALGSQKSAAIFSMEMSAESLTLRMLSSLGRINQGHLRSGRLQEEDWPRIDSAMTQLSSASIHVDETPGLTPTEVRARARRLKRERGLDLIVVDYLQLMQVSGTKENRATEISEISRSLKALAKELKVPVIALSQLNRGVEQRTEKKPVMSDLRECVTGDTLVCLADGRRVPIRDLVDQTPDVLSMTPDGRITRAQAEIVWRVGKKPVYEVTLASGRKLRATGKHRLYSSFGWQQVSDLGPGDRLGVARRLPEPEVVEKWPEDRVALLAHLIGDGSCLKQQPMRYATGSEACSELVRHAAEHAAAVLRYPSCPSRVLVSKYAELLEDEYLGSVSSSDIFWDRILKIDFFGEEDVYDLTVPETACWLADGIVSHNSGAIEQDADLILLIYREEVYDPNTTRKGIADIIIAKQRNGPTGEVQLTFLGQYTKFENYAPESYAEGVFR
jgi:replicative DNA helicase